MNQLIFLNGLDFTTKFSTEEKYNLFINEFKKLYDTYFPLKKISKIIKQKYPPAIRRLSNEKIRLYSLSRKFPDNGMIKTNLKIISNQLKKQLKLFSNQIEKDQISKGKNSIYNI